jgi:hypothetical protein
MPTNPLTIDDVRKLRDALDGITPLPWEFDRLGLWITKTGGHPRVADIDPFDEDPTHLAEMRGYGSGQPQERNLAAIVALMNAAPRLLEIAMERLTEIEGAQLCACRHPKSDHSDGGDSGVQDCFYFTPGTRLYCDCDEFTAPEPVSETTEKQP